MNPIANLMVLFAALAGLASDAIASPIVLSCPSGLVVGGAPEGVTRALDQARPYLSELTDPKKLRERPYGIYPLQIATANVMRYAGDTHDVDLLRALVPYYERALSSRTMQDKVAMFYVRHTDGSTPRLSVTALPRAVPMWPLPSEQTNSVAAEYVLPAAQFLYAALRLMRTGTETAPRDSILKQFRDNHAKEIVQSTLLRWVDGPPSFSRHGWGCRDFAQNHRNFVQELRNRAIAPVATEPQKKAQCNAVTDADLFVMGMAAEALMLDHEPNSHFLSNDQRSALTSYLREAADLLQQRHVVSGSTAVFDPGSLNTHPDNRYAGVTTIESSCLVCRTGHDCRPQCTTFPGGRTNVPPPPPGLGWDLSHSRRLPLIYDSMRRVRTITGAAFPTQTSEAQLARQFSRRVWNGNNEKPVFSTFFDGTDGWYRVNYDGQASFGYAPNSFSMDVASFGFSFWIPVDKNVGTALRSNIEQDRAAICNWLAGSPSRALELAPELANIGP